jgi:hypothetical protein
MTRGNNESYYCYKFEYVLMLAGTTISENENIVAFRTTQIDHKLILLY